MEKEIWKDIPDYTGIYQCSNLGRVKRLEKLKYAGPRVGYVKLKEKILILSPTDRGYLMVCLTKDKKVKNCRVHRLIMKTFKANEDQTLSVNHINGIKTDNRIENLEWCTVAENNDHAIAKGLIKQKKGSLHHNSKFTDFRVLAIRRLFKIYPNTNQTSLARKLGVSRSTISDIVTNKTRISDAL